MISAVIAKIAGSLTQNLKIEHRSGHLTMCSRFNGFHHFPGGREDTSLKKKFIETY